MPNPGSVSHVRKPLNDTTMQTLHPVAPVHHGCDEMVRWRSLNWHRNGEHELSSSGFVSSDESQNPGVAERDTAAELSRRERRCELPPLIAASNGRRHFFFILKQRGGRRVAARRGHVSRAGVFFIPQMKMANCSSGPLAHITRLLLGPSGPQTHHHQSGHPRFRYTRSDPAARGTVWMPELVLRCRRRYSVRRPSSASLRAL
jgi:hypothetical protein